MGLAPGVACRAHAPPLLCLPPPPRLQMQQCGQPPQEIVDQLAPGMQASP